MAETITVEVAYALPEAQEVVALQLPAGTLLRDAIERSGLLDRHPEIDLTHAPCGIYARPARLDTVLRDRDRVEIYRPLIADPKEARRKRAERDRAAKRGKAAR